MRFLQWSVFPHCFSSQFPQRKEPLASVTLATPASWTPASSVWATPSLSRTTSSQGDTSMSSTGAIQSIPLVYIWPPSAWPHYNRPSLVHFQNKPHRDARSHGQVLWWPVDGAVERDTEEHCSTQTSSKQPHHCLVWSVLIHNHCAVSTC